MSGSRTVQIVGVTFVDDYPANLSAVADLVVDAEKAALGWSGDQVANESAEVAVALVRNPDNEHDANAVEVHVPALGRRRSMVGHLPRDLAARIGPSMDRGDQWDAHVAHVLIDPEHPDRPGLLIALERVATAA